MQRSTFPTRSVLFPLFPAIGLVAGCAHAASSTGQDHPVAALRRAPVRAMLQQTSEALVRGGHACRSNNDVVTCDVDDPARPTLAVSVGESNNDTHLFLIESFFFKVPDACQTLSAKLNDVQLSQDLVRVTCTQQNLVFSIPIFLPEDGLRDADLNRFVDGWQTVVRETLSVAGLVAYLK
jgi:hypothetical protein